MLGVAVIGFGSVGVEHGDESMREVREIVGCRHRSVIGTRRSVIALAACITALASL